jgi:putative ABC transport system permease protein
MEAMIQDIRFGLRSLWKSLGFTLVAVITLAFGIGANTAMFSVLNSVLFRPLQFPDSGRVMVVWKTMANGAPNAFSTPAFLEWRQQGGPTERMGAFSPVTFNLAGKDLPERVAGGKMNVDLLHVLGVQPETGRMFFDEEDRTGAGKVAILSDALWKTKFASRSDILGSAISLEGAPYTIVGIMPPGFHVISDKELFWTPLQLESANAQSSARNVHWLYAFMRIPARMDQKQTEAALQSIADRMKKEDATGEGGLGVTLQPLGDFFVGNVKPALLLLMGAVAFVLLIACSNVANLMLARGSMRSREISIRAAMGAGRARIVRHLLTESLLLALTGGLLGLGLAWVALKLLLAIHPSSIPSVDTIAIDVMVLVYTGLLCAVVGILFGITPALETSRIDLNEALKEGSRGSTSEFGKHRVALVVIETALASMLLIGAGLSLKSLWRAESVDLGFSPAGVFTFRIAAPPSFSGERIPLFYQQVLERIRALPGVQSAVLARNLPMSGSDPSMPIAIEGAAPPPSDTPILTRFRAIGPDYFRALQTRLQQGREFYDYDNAAAPRVAIVSESLARLYWPNENALGKRLKPQMPGGDWHTVVGIAGDVHHWSADVALEPTAYYPYTQVPVSFLPLLEGVMSIAVRAGNTAGLLPSIRAAVADVDRTVPVYDMKRMEEMVAESGSLRRFDMWLIGAFAVLALMLATFGIYGVMAYSVSQRSREIAIRIALGAQQPDVLRLIMGQGAKLAFAGVAFGLAGAFALTRLMESLLFGVTSKDPLTFAAVPPIVLVAILAGCYIPARRATRLHPLEALRKD